MRYVIMLSTKDDGLLTWSLEADDALDALEDWRNSTSLDSDTKAYKLVIEGPIE